MGPTVPGAVAPGTPSGSPTATEGLDLIRPGRPEGGLRFRAADDLEAKPWPERILPEGFVKISLAQKRLREGHSSGNPDLGPLDRDPQQADFLAFAGRSNDFLIAQFEVLRPRMGRLLAVDPEGHLDDLGGGAGLAGSGGCRRTGHHCHGERRESEQCSDAFHGIRLLEL